MLQNRIEGLSLLLGLAKLVLFPFWSIAVLVFSVEFLDLLDYEQVNFPVYGLGLLAAFAIGLNFRRRPILTGPPRKFWIGSIQQSNIDLLILGFVVFALIYATKDKAISRQFVGLYLVSSWLVLVFLNRYFPAMLSRVFFHGEADIATLLVGSVSHAQQYAAWALDQRSVGLDVKGLVVLEESELAGIESPVAVIGSLQDLEHLISRHSIQQVVLLDAKDNVSFVQFVVEACQDNGCRLLVANPWEAYLQQSLVSVTEGNHSFFTLAAEPLQNPANRVLKRLLDVAVSLPVCLFLLPPLALLVKLGHSFQSPGPLFLQQNRTGKEMKTFQILKFRSMHVDDGSSENVQATRADSRIFPFGAFLRKTSLDEIPQFWNVLTGRMSVVGPRPHLIQHDMEFARQVQIYKTRHHAKPGITGMAQHRGYRGEIKTAEDIDQRIRLDLQYIQNWSIWLDIGIILKTAWQVLFPPPRAY